MKICSRCKVEQDLSNFYKTDGYCKPCRRIKKREYYANNPNHYKSYTRTRVYGLTPDNISQLKTLQKERCGICQQALAAKFCVDHDHITGEVRGLLCYNCNTAIGKLQERASLLRRAALWVEGGGIGGIGESQ